MHYRKITSLILAFFFFIHLTSTASSEKSIVNLLPEDRVLDFATVDSTSYNLWEQQHWKELSAFCEKAIGSGFDYYYLRIRAGIALFKLNKYRQAIVHFSRALEFNSNDDLALSYLYSCYIQAERFEEARWLIKRFSPSYASSLGLDRLSKIDFIVFENGFKSADSSNLFKTPFFFNAGLGHSVGQRLSLFHNFSFFTQQEARFNVNQFQYYLRASVPLAHDLKISVAAHVVNVNLENKSYLPVANTVTYQLLTPSGPQIGKTSFTTYNEEITKKSSIYYVGAVDFSKHSSFADVHVGGLFASLDTVYQGQAHLGLSLYPLGNNKLSVGLTSYIHKETSADLAFAPYLNLQVTSKILLNLFYLQNNGPNIIENNGYLVNNSIDYTRQRIGAALSFKLTPSTSIYGVYAHERKQQFTQLFTYNYQIFTLGLKVIP